MRAASTVSTMSTAPASYGKQQHERQPMTTPQTRRAAVDRPCKDCTAQGITTTRPAPHPGPRCATHHRTAKQARAARAHGRRIQHGYGITATEYWAIHASQGGVCYVCRRATGRTKRLAVDHDHHKPGCAHPPDVGCPNCIRCLACGPCNRDLLGRYDVAALRRAIEVLTDPPAQKTLVSI